MEQNKTKNLMKTKDRASLMAQWKRFCLLVQEMWVRSLVQEDPMYLGATHPYGITI